MKQRYRILSLLFALLILTATLTGCGSFPLGKDSETTPPPPADSSFTVHFIDVGQADAALVICDGKTMLIDGGNAEDSNLIYSYLNRLSISYLDYVVCTHAHEDHVGGLSGALSKASLGVALSPVKSYDTRAFSNFVDKVKGHGKELTVPKAGDSFSLGSASVTVLGPVKAYEETNDTSLVLRVVYGETSFLFTGDMESTAEADLLDEGAALRSTVLKVGHHGSSTSTSYRFLREVAPTYAVISVGTDNSYDHPNEDVLSRLRDADVTLYRTDLQGDIICTSDGKAVTFTTAKNNGISTNPTVGSTSEGGATEYAYVGNLESKKFHTVTCKHLPGENNRIYFITREEATSKGYEPCGVCKP
ncbi:MAG: MBL fold metallo-hydrolase [Ruminococcaceae bacterium]|nr:MBL fold metallo-hydrolase [Oscillospiraceae bacterium]